MAKGHELANLHCKRAVYGWSANKHSAPWMFHKEPRERATSLTLTEVRAVATVAHQPGFSHSPVHGLIIVNISQFSSKRKANATITVNKENRNRNVLGKF